MAPSPFEENINARDVANIYRSQYQNTFDYATSPVCSTIGTVISSFSNLGDTIRNTATKLKNAILPNKNISIRKEISDWLHIPKFRYISKEKCNDKVGYKTLREEIKDWLRL